MSDTSSSSSLSPSPTTSRSPEFWFDDGSMILQVETTQFRVHRGIICANSNFFRDMHELPEPGKTEIVDGCPLVVLDGDTVTDWSNLLRYIYFPAKSSKPGEHISFPVVVSLLRLGRKYGFANLWTLALRTMRVQVPIKDVKTWHMFLLDDHHFEDDNDDIPGRWLQGHEMDLLTIAIEHDIETILPVAYYLCTHKYSLTQILSGVERDDGPLSTVHPDALHTLLLGRQKLQSAFYQKTMSWLTQPGDTPSGDCEYSAAALTGESACKEQRDLALEKLNEVDMDLARAFNLIGPAWYDGFCLACRDNIIQTYDMQRAKIWADLPAYFDLPPWSELKDPELNEGQTSME